MSDLRVLGRNPTRQSAEGPSTLGKAVSLGLTFTRTFGTSTSLTVTRGWRIPRFQITAVEVVD